MCIYSTQKENLGHRWQHLAHSGSYQMPVLSQVMPVLLGNDTAALINGKNLACCRICVYSSFLDVLLSTLMLTMFKEMGLRSSKKPENSQYNHPAIVSSVAKDNRESRGRIEEFGESVQQ